MTDIIHYFGEGDDDFIVDPSLDAAIRALGLQVDLRSFYYQYVRCHWEFIGHLYVFHGVSTTTDVFAIDLHRGDDQWDLITLIFVSSRNRQAQVRHHLQPFFDRSAYNMRYEERVDDPTCEKMLDPSRYPLLRQGASYLQQLRYIPAGTHQHPALQMPVQIPA